MLVIRMQRIGRKGHAQFRVIVQDARRTPTSGNIVASIGHFDPHTKQTTLDKQKASFYLEHGAQPSGRVARLLKAEGVKLPKWVVITKAPKRPPRNPDKFSKNSASAPAKTEDEPTNEPAETKDDNEVPAETAEEATPAETTNEVAEAEATEPETSPVEEAPADEKAD